MHQAVQALSNLCVGHVFGRLSLSADGNMRSWLNRRLQQTAPPLRNSLETVDGAHAACVDLNRSKRNYLSSVVSKEPSFVNVGAYHYALRAFPGVTEAGAKVGMFVCPCHCGIVKQMRGLALRAATLPRLRLAESSCGIKCTLAEMTSHESHAVSGWRHMTCRESQGGGGGRRQSQGGGRGRAAGPFCTRGSAGVGGSGSLSSAAAASSNAGGDISSTAAAGRTCATASSGGHELWHCVDVSSAMATEGQARARSITPDESRTRNRWRPPCSRAACFSSHKHLAGRGGTLHILRPLHDCVTQIRSTGGIRAGLTARV